MFKLNTAFAAAALGLACITANAALSRITMTGVDLVYDQARGSICDAGGLGGGGVCGVDSGPADLVASMSFYLGNVLQGTYSNLGGEPTIGFNLLLLVQSGTSPTAAGATPTLASAFDVFDVQINSAAGLFTDVTSGEVSFGNSGLSLGGSGLASQSGVVNLPFGLVGAGPYSWSFETGNAPGSSNCTGSAGSLICTYSGTAQISWGQQQLPEPSTMLLAGASLFGMAMARRRRLR